MGRVQGCRSSVSNLWGERRAAWHEQARPAPDEAALGVVGLGVIQEHAARAVGDAVNYPKQARALLRRLKRAGYVKPKRRRFYRGGLPGLGKRR